MAKLIYKNNKKTGFQDWILDTQKGIKFGVGSMRKIKDSNGNPLNVFVLNMDKYFCLGQIVNMDETYIDELVKIATGGGCASYIFWEAQEYSKSQIPVGPKQWRMIDLSTITSPSNNKRYSSFSTREYSQNFSGWKVIPAPVFI